MQHSIPVETLGPQGPAMAEAVDKCVHCGFCLATCPTYQVLGEETDSPRGRIYLMKEALEGNLTVDEVTPYVDRCLGCMACVTSCPSGVAYGELLTPFRSLHEPSARAHADRATDAAAGQRDLALSRPLPSGRAPGQSWPARWRAPCPRACVACSNSCRTNCPARRRCPTSIRRKARGGRGWRF